MRRKQAWFYDKIELKISGAEKAMHDFNFNIFESNINTN